MLIRLIIWCVYYRCGNQIAKTYFDRLVKCSFAGVGVVCLMLDSHTMCEVKFVVKHSYFITIKLYATLINVSLYYLYLFKFPTLVSTLFLSMGLNDQTWFQY